MPTPNPRLTEADVAEIVTGCCRPRGDRQVGVELEWLTYPLDDPVRRPTLADLRDALDPVALEPGAGVSIEPGGQVELSSAPETDLGALTAGLDRDRIRLLAALASAGLGALSVAHDPLRAVHCLDLGPRYAAMRSYLGADGPAGPAMMANTVSVQVNVDAGSGPEAVRRWELAHLLGPVLIAMFANSPFADGRPSGWASTRMALWQRIDRTRTGPARTGGDPVADWTAYALAARVMLIRTSPERFVAVGSGMTLRDWVRHGHDLGHPDAGDVAYHLTTLFPPVRLRGWLELRTVDSLPDPWWRVAVAVVAAALLEPTAGEQMRRACLDVRGTEVEAARHGLAHPGLAAAAQACLRAAVTALPRLGVDATTTEACTAYLARYVERGLTPADALLAAYAEGATVGIPEPLVTLAR